MSANDNYEKLQLSRQDLRYLFNQMRREMNSRLDYHVPGSGPHDPLKLQVEQQLNKYLISTFEMAKHALVVDGHDMGVESSSIKEVLSLNSEQQVEPFDIELNNNLREIIGEVEAETTAMTKLRREIPQSARDAYLKLVEETDMEVTSTLEELDKIRDEEGAGVDIKTLIPKIDEIMKDYELSLLLLSESKKSIPELRAEFDSLDDTIKFLESKQQK